MSVSINLPLNDVLQSIERPVVFDIIRQVMNQTQISSDTQIRFYGEDAKAAQYNSTITKDQSANNLWPHRENVTIEVDEDTDPNLSFFVKRPDNRYVFWDNDLEIFIKPVYMPTSMNIRVQYKAVDRNQALKWHNEMRSKVMMGRDVLMHQINYSWHVPDEFLVILEQLWTLREAIGGYGDSFPDYVTKNITNRSTLTTTFNGQDGFLAITEQQIYVQGYFDFSAGLPEKASRDDEPNLWVTSFTYKFFYDKPIESVMNYPIMVHQQLLSDKYRPTETVPSYLSYVKQFSYSGEDAANFRVENQIAQYYGNRGIRIPAFDNVTFTSEPASTVPALVALASITEANLQSLMNLSDLGQFNFNQNVLNFIFNSEYPYITGLYQSVLQLNLYAGRYIQQYGSVACDNKGNVSLVAPGDLRTTYRLRLSMVIDFKMLPAPAIARLRANPVAAQVICTAINAALTDQSFRYDFRKSRLTPTELAMVGLGYDANYNVIIGAGSVPYDPNAKHYNNSYTAETLFIIANRSGEIPLSN